MKLDLASAIVSLRTSAAAIQSLAEVPSPEDAGWKPSPEKWSIVEVINHLADEEVEDFRARLEVILHRPESEFAPIDPPGWVVARRYAERDLRESVERFRMERVRSLVWLEGIEESSLNRSKPHPRHGPITGWRLLANWMAHDLLHVRQITRLRYERLGDRAAPLSLEYAGEWK